MIAAEQAKNITQERLNSWFKRTMASISDRIDKFASIGQDRCTYSIAETTDFLDRKKKTENIICALKGLGYKVKREKGDDQRDCSSWDYMVISW